MDADVIRLAATGGLFTGPAAPTVKYGIITAVNGGSVSVRFGDAANGTVVDNVPRLGSYIPRVGDYVQVLDNGGALTVQDKVLTGSDPLGDQTGQTDADYSAVPFTPTITGSIAPTSQRGRFTRVNGFITAWYNFAWSSGSGSFTFNTTTPWAVVLPAPAQLYGHAGGGVGMRDFATTAAGGLPYQIRAYIPTDGATTSDLYNTTNSAFGFAWGSDFGTAGHLCWFLDLCLIYPTKY